MSLSALRLGGGALRELRVHLCQSSPASAGVRAFLEKEYVGLKKTNPDFPILIRECSGISPKIWARYAKGVERHVDVENLPAEKVTEVVKLLAEGHPL